VGGSVFAMRPDASRCCASRAAHPARRLLVVAVAARCRGQRVSLHAATDSAGPAVRAARGRGARRTVRRRCRRTALAWRSCARQRRRPTARPQLHVMPSDGGDARCVTTLARGVSGRSGHRPRRIAFTSRVRSRAATARRPTSGPAARSGHRGARRLTRMDYRLDDIGYVATSTPRLYVLDWRQRSTRRRRRCRNRSS